MAGRGECWGQRNRLTLKPVLNLHCMCSAGLFAHQESIIGEAVRLAAAGPGPAGPAGWGCRGASSRGAAGSGKGGSSPINRLMWSLSAGCTGHRPLLRCFSSSDCRLSRGEAGASASRRRCTTLVTASDEPCCSRDTGGSGRGTSNATLQQQRQRLTPPLCYLFASLW